MDKDEARRKYGDIIDLPYHGETAKKRMPLYDRAAQFAPFKALSGYDDMVQEESRLTESETVLSEYDAEMLNKQLRQLDQAVSRGEAPQITVTYFRPDSKKSGGSYEILTARVKCVDALSQKLVLYGSDNTDDRTVRPKELEFLHILEINEL